MPRSDMRVLLSKRADFDAPLTGTPEKAYGLVRTFPADAVHIIQSGREKLDLRVGSRPEAGFMKYVKIVLGSLGVIFLLTVILLIATLISINDHIDRCLDQSHGKYIWDDAARKAACD